MHRQIHQEPGWGGSRRGSKSSEQSGMLRRSEVDEDLIYSSSSSSSSSSSPSSSPSGVGASPAFLPGLSPNHFGSFLLGLLVHSSYFSFQTASKVSALITTQPPSYSFFLSSYVLVSVLLSYLEYI